MKFKMQSLEESIRIAFCEAFLYRSAHCMSVLLTLLYNDKGEALPIDHIECHLFPSISRSRSVPITLVYNGVANGFLVRNENEQVLGLISKNDMASTRKAFYEVAQWVDR